MHIAMPSLQGDRDKKMYVGKSEHWEKIICLSQKSVLWESSRGMQVHSLHEGLDGKLA